MAAPARWKHLGEKSKLEPSATARAPRQKKHIEHEAEAEWRRERGRQWEQSWVQKRERSCRRYLHGTKLWNYLAGWTERGAIIWMGFPRVTLAKMQTRVWANDGNGWGQRQRSRPGAPWGNPALDEGDNLVGMREMIRVHIPDKNRSAFAVG